MSPPRLFKRKLRICYYNVDQQSLNSLRISLEAALQSLGEFEILPVTGLADPARLPCDLFLVHAINIKEETFPAWLYHFSQRMEQQGNIWIPAIFVSEVSWHILRSMTEKAVQMNWYFDIVSPQHIDSLPVRIANLLRIHDHLHELKRYEASLNELSVRLEDLAEAVQRLRGLSEHE